jgi:hypothetical protein
MAPHRRGNWTDDNTHDPGVTLLEMLAYGVSDLAASVGRRIRLDKCGWRCALLIAAGAVAAVLAVQRRKDY